MTQFKVIVTKKGMNINQLRKVLEPIKDIISIETIRPAKTRADRLAEAENMVADAKSIVEELQQEMQEWYDNMPENLQSSSKGDEVQEAADSLQSMYDDLENVDFCSVTFPGMY